MFAVDHAATALLIKRRFPSVSLTPMLAVGPGDGTCLGRSQLPRHRTNHDSGAPSAVSPTFTWPTCRIRIRSRPPSALRLLAWLIVEKGFGRAFLAVPIGLGIVSHLILDLVTHGHDIVLWPGLAAPKLGLGLYAAAPMVAFFVELTYGTFCWYVYRGGPGLLALITIGNLANLSIFSSDIPGPEQYLAGRPLLLVTFIFVQIVVTLVLVGSLARRHSEASPERWSADHHLAAQHR